MNYTLKQHEDGAPSIKTNWWEPIKRLWPFVADEKVTLFLAFVAILLSSVLTIFAPIMIGHAIDTYMVKGDYHGVLVYSSYILAVYLGTVVTNYLQTRLMGQVGQSVLFKLRNTVFAKLQELPVAFFNQNKAGDLISRINNDTDTLNQFFSRSLMQFVGNAFVIVGAGVAMVVVNDRLGFAALVPAVLLLVLTQLTTSWIKRRNLESLQTKGGLTGEIQESLDNFKVIVAFNRRDYFRTRFAEVNQKNYDSSVKAGIANITYTPFFGLASNAGQLIVIVYGLSLITSGLLTFGVLISYLAYVSRFYDPLRQMAQLWADFQSALAGWERISEILNLSSNLEVIESKKQAANAPLLEFKNVSFGYPNGKVVLDKIGFELEAGKTYALVGPTGGGKTTTASLMARLYDPTSGTVLLNGRDIRSYEPQERTQKIGFILQDPFLFSGTVRDNILYGNEKYHNLTNEELADLLKKEQLGELLERFDQGLATPVASTGDTLSLGQRQLIAFIRTMLRHPELLILDEATANIDTVTEQLLEKTLARLPKSTTQVVIAHRLNTIENADKIFFVNGTQVTPAGSLEHAIKMLTGENRSS